MRTALPDGPDSMEFKLSLSFQLLVEMPILI